MQRRYSQITMRHILPQRTLADEYRQDFAIAGDKPAIVEAAADPPDRPRLACMGDEPVADIELLKGNFAGFGEDQGATAIARRPVHGDLAAGTIRAQLKIFPREIAA